MTEFEIKRLTRKDLPAAKTMFEMMARVFEEDYEPLDNDYLGDLLRREEFWALAAFAGPDLVGGLTAHTLPMTRSPSSEVFIYDLAVRQDHRRRGVASRLVTELRAAAAANGIHEVFVPADDDDRHALAFYRALGAVASPVTMFTFGD
ncbi:GNAT family N-acetyltransferase [Arthrobacter pityocampae]|uniref:GNAT family N-acetyltransferase n=1 Tax=Arthrobacter pityocampae TaxID=547334 RepID=UPI0037360E4D